MNIKGIYYVPMSVERQFLCNYTVSSISRWIGRKNESRHTKSEFISPRGFLNLNIFIHNKYNVIRLRLRDVKKKYWKNMNKFRLNKIQFLRLKLIYTLYIQISGSLFCWPVVNKESKSNRAKCQCVDNRR